jgi:hypothetical protein
MAPPCALLLPVAVEAAYFDADADSFSDAHGLCSSQGMLTHCRGSRGVRETRFPFLRLFHDAAQVKSQSWDAFLPSRTTRQAPQ